MYVLQSSGNSWSVVQRHARSCVQVPPMLADMSASTWIKKVRLQCCPLYSQQVSHQRWIWGISAHEQWRIENGESSLAMKLRADISRRQKSKTGWQLSGKKNLCSPKFYKNIFTVVHVLLLLTKKNRFPGNFILNTWNTHWFYFLD